MKFLAALLLLILLCITYVKAKDEQCEKNGGSCVSASAKGSCEKLPYQCGPDTLCCKKIRTINKTSCKFSPACKKQGGFCINIKKPAYCAGGTIDAKLCKGKKCACCIINKPVKCQCGQFNEARIIGGDEVAPKNKYPWMVGLAAPVFGDKYFCGGTVINDRYVITAAHCLYISGGPLRAKYIKIGLADHNITSADDDVQGVTRLVDIETYKVHDKWDPVSQEGDIALIKLKEPLDLSSNKEIKPVCLPTDKDETYNGTDGIVAGWGLTNYSDPNSRSDVLLEVTLPIMSPKCKGNFSFEPTKITETMLCAGSFKEGGKSGCLGDSGGPFVVKEDSVHTLVGIVSFGRRHCGKPNFPSVFTRVTQYLNWISENSNDGNYCL